MKSLTLIFFLFVVSSNSHFIIFENIGKMASSVTYINVKLTLKISEVEEMIIKYGQFLDKKYTQYVNIRKDMEQPAESRHIAQQGEEIIYTFKLDYHNLKDDFNLVRWLLPVEPNRSRRQLAEIGLAFGFMGTFMGVYNTIQIHLLEAKIDNMKGNIDKIVQGVLKISDEQLRVEESMVWLDSRFNAWITLDPALLAIRIGRMEKVLRNLVTRVRNTFSMAQAHRFSIDFYQAEDLTKLYENIANLAKKNKLELITEKPLDLFQIETSYFSDGKDLQLVLHVPAVAPNSLLKLYKMYPLPIPISTDLAMIPQVTDNVLGLTHGPNKLAAHLSSTDLLDCKNINKIFLCERHAVLEKQINSSCLGALYLQDFDSAKQLCPLHTEPITEIVRQLADNWFLIYSPKPQTAQITCSNGTESQFYIQEGMSKRHLSSGCKAEFINHILNTDNSITLENNIQHFDWTWLADLDKIDDIKQQLDEMHKLGFKHPTLSELHNFNDHNIGGINQTWKIVLKVITITIVSIALLLVLICFTNRTVLRHFCACMLFAKDQPEDTELTDLPPQGHSAIHDALRQQNSTTTSRPDYRSNTWNRRSLDRHDLSL